MKKKSKTTSHKIGLYIRVSTEEQAKNPEGSIKSQEQRLQQFIEFKGMNSIFGEVVGIFIDEARSGKDTNRPQLQRLLRAIQQGEINLVMVTELSRLSRSIRDFSDIWEMMKAHGCQFLSLRENFDTTNAAGEMVLFTIANAAQFERKQVSERVSANFLARAKRGLHNGGSLPLGYQPHPEQSGHLMILEEDAAIVREAFATYLGEGGLSRAAISLNQRGYRIPRLRKGLGGSARLGFFTVDNLQRILKNKSYLGLRIYHEDGEEKMVKACWPAIVDEEIFYQVQNLLKKNKEDAVKLPSAKRYPYILSNITWCGECGKKLSGKSAHGAGGKVPYYEHSASVKHQISLGKKTTNCVYTRVQAKIAEPLVWSQIEKLVTDDAIAQMLVAKAQEQHQTNAAVTESDRLRAKIRDIDLQLDALTEHLSKIPKGVSPTPIYAQMEKLNTLQNRHKREHDDLLNSGEVREEPVSLKDYRAFLSTVRKDFYLNLDPEEKAKLVKSLIGKIEILPAGIKIHYKIGAAHLKMQKKTQKSNDLSSSRSLTNGADERT